MSEKFSDSLDFVPDSGIEQLEMLTIGSSLKADVLIEHNSIDSVHCSIQKMGDGMYRIVDLNSKGGIYFRGKRTKESLVSKKDTIQIGAYPISVGLLSAHFLDQLTTEIEDNNT
ncbi:MAG: FHA domain-containing protein, partial [Myxococcota bacterium]|nr:FHA domain-containing protein [Myxococcota bacterium]